MNISLKNSDSIGVISSSLCLLHCIATPFLFAIQTQIINLTNAKPSWWSSLDFVFILLSAIAIYKTTLTTTRKWVKYALWIGWILLFFVIMNEKLGLFSIPEPAIYIPSLGLIGVHLYNRKYCQCENETCCVSKVQNHG